MFQVRRVRGTRGLSKVQRLLPGVGMDDRVCVIEAVRAEKPIAVRIVSSEKREVDSRPVDIEKPFLPSIRPSFVGPRVPPPPPPPLLARYSEIRGRLTLATRSSVKETLEKYMSRWDGQAIYRVSNAILAILVSGR